MKTRLFKNDIDEAVEIIKSGGLVAVPTETVYGLGCNALDANAVDRLYSLKGRPEVKPLSIMVSGKKDIEKYCINVPEAAYVLAERFWPGPLTIVLEARENIPEIVRAGGRTVGLRCPDHPFTLKLLNALKIPLAAPSANPSGEDSPKNAEQVLAYFDGAIDGIIDGGESCVGVESSLVDLTTAPYTVLREKALSRGEIFAPLVDALAIIGITGGTGCGKTTALSVLADMGAFIIDCDKVYHELLDSSEPLLYELRENFPDAFESGSFSRKALGKIVFSDDTLLNRLNSITHRYVNMRVNELLTEWAISGGKIAAVDAIELIGTEISKKCRAVVGITAPDEKRIPRLMKREGISEEYAKLRISAQKPNSYFEKNCDFTVFNDSTVNEFIEKCEKLFDEILNYGG